MANIRGPLRNFVDGVRSYSVMLLQVRRLPGSDDGQVVRVDREDPAVDVVDKMSDGVLDSQELPEVRSVVLLFRT